MMKIESIQEVLQAFKDGRSLQVRGISSGWADGNGLSLEALMDWISLGKSIRVAPPEPRSVWVGECRTATGHIVVLNHAYSTREGAERHAGSAVGFIRAVEFVEKMET